MEFLDALTVPFKRNCFKLLHSDSEFSQSPRNWCDTDAFNITEDKVVHKNMDNGCHCWEQTSQAATNSRVSASRVGHQNCWRMKSVIRVAPGVAGPAGWHGPTAAPCCELPQGQKGSFRGPPPGLGWACWACWAILTADSTPQVTTPTTRAGGRIVSTAGLRFGVLSRGTVGIGHLPWRSWSPDSEWGWSRTDWRTSPSAPVSDAASWRPGYKSSSYDQFRSKQGCWAPSSQCRPLGQGGVDDQELPITHVIVGLCWGEVTGTGRLPGGCAVLLRPLERVRPWCQHPKRLPQLWTGERAERRMSTRAEVNRLPSCRECVLSLRG